MKLLEVQALALLNDVHMERREVAVCYQTQRQDISFFS